MNWKPYIERYEKELLENVVPFWLNHAQDREYGGFFTCLDRDGSVYDYNKYMWMQWRIVYMFATLYASEYGKGHSDWLDGDLISFTRTGGSPTEVTILN